MWGIFRVHQFEKVEQFVICKEDESWALHEEMIKTAQDFYTNLGLPHRTINIVAGALNDAAAKKYDLEAWFPGYGQYRELVSCSNCTDFQSRGLEVKHGTKKTADQEGSNLTHMLNATLAATTRTMCCILENYQKEDGVVIPEVLRPYFGNREFLQYKPDCVEQYLKDREKDLKEQEEKAAKEAAKAAAKAAKAGK